MDIAKSETLKHFTVLSKALLFLIKFQNYLQIVRVVLF